MNLLEPSAPLNKTIQLDFQNHTYTMNTFYLVNKIYIHITPGIKSQSIHPHGKYLQ